MFSDTHAHTSCARQNCYQGLSSRKPWQICTRHFKPQAHKSRDKMSQTSMELLVLRLTAILFFRVETERRRNGYQNGREANRRSKGLGKLEALRDQQKHPDSKKPAALLWYPFQFFCVTSQKTLKTRFSHRYGAGFGWQLQCFDTKQPDVIGCCLHFLAHCQMSHHHNYYQHHHHHHHHHHCHHVICYHLTTFGAPIFKEI